MNADGTLSSRIKAYPQRENNGSQKCLSPTYSEGRNEIRNKVPPINLKLVNTFLVEAETTKASR